MMNVLQFIGLFLLMLAVYLLGKHQGRLEMMERFNIEELCRALEDLFGDNDEPDNENDTL